MMTLQIQLYSRTGYAIKTEKPVIARSPYIQIAPFLSFWGANIIG